MSYQWNNKARLLSYLPQYFFVLSWLNCILSQNEVEWEAKWEIFTIHLSDVFHYDESDPTLMG